MNIKLKEPVEESITWKSIREKDGWTMYIPDNNVCWKIKDYHGKYANMWFSYGKCKSKLALINIINHTVMVESISVFSLEQVTKL